MVRVEISSVKIQPRKAGGFMVTIPVAVAKILGIENSEILRVFIDIKEKEIVYKLKE